MIFRLHGHHIKIDNLKESISIDDFNQPSMSTSSLFADLQSTVSRLWTSCQQQQRQGPQVIRSVHLSCVNYS
ncbi:hypothetical protein L596_027134 [Steinernema carpocapsae]|uniref:Uncharacterized protein n=1 Tax=Steinernema carpocapsae TaxID=34508 RepID=A0A4U5M3F5_STECR|nr:hypothetical protein L596_027134 [Steinernema carpocapsae]